MVVDACLLTAFGCFIYAFTSDLQFTNMWFGINTVQATFLASISTIQIFIFSTNPRSSTSASSGGATESGAGTSGTGTTDSERDSDGYIKADLTCCGKKIRRQSSMGTLDSTANDTVFSGKSIDSRVPDSDIVDGVVVL